MALADADAGSERVDGVVVEGAFRNQTQRTRDRGRRSVPGGCVGRNLGAATEAGPESRFFSGCGAGEEHAGLLVRRWSGTDWPAIDSGALDAGEKAAVEAAVAGSYGAIAGVAVEFHDSIIVQLGFETSRFRTWTMGRRRPSIEMNVPSWMMMESWNS